MWQAFKEALLRLFNVVVSVADVANDLAMSAKNASASIEKHSRTLIPTDEQLAADLELAKAERDLALQLALAKLVVKQDNASKEADKAAKAKAAIQKAIEDAKAKDDNK